MIHRPSLCVYLLLHLTCINARLSDILKTCDDVIDCEMRDQRSVAPAKAQYKFLSSGVGQIFWDAVIDGSIYDNISATCKRQLDQVKDGMLEDKHRDAYLFIDSSSKTPSGTLMGTITSLGHYDQCLAVNYSGIRGRYCTVDMYNLRKQWIDEELSLDDEEFPYGYPRIYAMCLPDACSEHDVRSSLSHVMKAYAVIVNGDVTCETADEFKFSDLSSKQVVSIAVILLILIYSTTSTALDMCGSRNRLSDASLIRSTRTLFYSDMYSDENRAFDGFKYFIIASGVIGHIVNCPESPLGFTMLADLKFYRGIQMSAAGQFLLNDSGLLGIPFLTGMITFATLYPAAIHHKLSYPSALLKRTMKIIPSIIILTACEFIWPLISSGPLYKRFADFNLIRCQKNWFKNLLFINNHMEATDICAAHSFYFSIDMQLFILGLMCIWIFSKSERMGLLFCIFMAVHGSMHTAYSAHMNDVPLSIYGRIVKPVDVQKYLHVIHFSTFSYTTAYFAGFIVSFFMMRGGLRVDLSNRRTHVVFVIITALLASSVNFNSMMNHTFELWHRNFNWLYINLNRLLHLATYVSVAIYLKSWLKNLPKKRCSPQADPMRALFKLAVPLNISNYLFIRTEFFSSRQLFPAGGYWLSKRIFSTFIIAHVVAFLFHVLLSAPVNVLSQRLIIRFDRKTGKQE